MLAWMHKQMQHQMHDQNVQQPSAQDACGTMLENLKFFEPRQRSMPLNALPAPQAAVSAPPVIATDDSQTDTQQTVTGSSAALQPRAALPARGAG